MIATDIQPDDVRVGCDGVDDATVGLPLLQILIRTRVVGALGVRQISCDENNCRLQISHQIGAFQVQNIRMERIFLFAVSFQYECV